MFNVVASFEAERHAAYGIASEEAARYAHAPLVSRALMLQPRARLLLILAVGALEQHGVAFAVQTRHADELPLLLRD